jgi:hypothetical protein
MTNLRLHHQYIWSFGLILQICEETAVLSAARMLSLDEPINAARSMSIGTHIMSTAIHVTCLFS